MTSKNKYQIWLTYNGEKEKIQLPVLPEQFSVSTNSKDQSVDIVGLGEILIAQNRPALEFSFSSFLPRTSFPGVQTAKLKDPKTIRDKILKWKESKKPVHLIVTGHSIDCYCRIAKFKPSEKGGDVGTIYYDITLKEYREISVRQVKIENKTQTASVSQNTQRPDNTSAPKTYKVVSGDCLWNLAKKFYGDGSKYMKIYNANPNVFKGRSPNLLYVGEVLKIPK